MNAIKPFDSNCDKVNVIRKSSVIVTIFYRKRKKYIHFKMPFITDTIWKKWRKIGTSTRERSFTFQRSRKSTEGVFGDFRITDFFNCSAESFSVLNNFITRCSFLRPNSCLTSDLTPTGEKTLSERRAWKQFGSQKFGKK